MAARGRPKGIWTPQIVKDRIKVGLIARRVQNHALNKNDPERGKFYEPMTDSQLKAANILLSYCLPKPQEIDMTTHGAVNVIIDDPTQRPDDYQRKGAASDKSGE